MHAEVRVTGDKKERQSISGIRDTSKATQMHAEVRVTGDKKERQSISGIRDTYDKEGLEDSHQTSVPPWHLHTKTQNKQNHTGALCFEQIHFLAMMKNSSTGSGQPSLRQIVAGLVVNSCHLIYKSDVRNVRHKH